MTVYIEYVLIDNFVIDWLLLKAALTTAGLTAARSRLFFSALVGAAVALVYPAIEVHAAILVLLKISAGFFMVLISAKFNGVKNFVIVSALFFVYTALLGGAITAVFSVFNINGSEEFCTAFMIVPAYILIKAVREIVRFIYRRKDTAAFTYRTEITAGGITVSVNGFLDTGNGLYDGDSPVIVCSVAVAQKFLSGGKIRAVKRIPVGTVNGKKFLPAFVADSVKIYAEESPCGIPASESETVTVCAAKTGFSCGYDVILPPGLIKPVRREMTKNA